MDDVGPVGVAFGRLLLATVTIGGWLLFRRGPAGVRAMLAGIRPDQAAVFATTGSAAPFLLIAWAETRITSSLAGILNASIPLMTAGLALYLRMPGRIRGGRSARLLLGSAGVALVAGGDLSGQPRDCRGHARCRFPLRHQRPPGSALLRRRGPSGGALVQVAVGTLVALPSLAFLRIESAPLASAVAALVALGVRGTGFAYFLYYSLVSSAGPQHAVAVIYLVPIAAVI